MGCGNNNRKCDVIHPRSNSRHPIGIIARINHQLFPTHAVYVVPEVVLSPSQLPEALQTIFLGIPVIQNNSIIPNSNLL
jgi:hypothetical protein